MGLSSTPIQIEWFHHLEGEKTKLNWFLLEVALDYYGRIRDGQELSAYRERYDERQVAQFCTYYARRLKQSLLNYLQGRRKTVIFYLDYVEDFYPHHDRQLNLALHRMAKASFDHMWYACRGCPQGCLEDYGSRCLVFDTYGEGGRLR
jgi:hypothetical protein